MGKDDWPEQFRGGIASGIAEFVGGILVSYILAAFRDTGLIDPSYMLLFEILNIILIIGPALIMPYWGTPYLLGWLIGLGIMLSSGITITVESWIYLIIGIAIVCLRILKSVWE